MLLKLTTGMFSTMYDKTKVRVDCDASANGGDDDEEEMLDDVGTLLHAGMASVAS